MGSCHIVWEEGERERRREGGREKERGGEGSTELFALAAPVVCPGTICQERSEDSSNSVIWTRISSKGKTWKLDGKPASTSSGTCDNSSTLHILPRLQPSALLGMAHPQEHSKPGKVNQAGPVPSGGWGMGAAETISKWPGGRLPGKGLSQFEKRL